MRHYHVVRVVAAAIITLPFTALAICAYAVMALVHNGDGGRRER